MKQGARAGAVPIGLTLLLIAARAAAVPALSDPVNGTPGPLSLGAPTLYLFFAPLFTLWDGISLLSMTRLKGFLLGLAILYFVWRMIHWVSRVSKARAGAGRRRWGRGLLRELGVLAVTLVLLLSFLLTGALWHRPMLSLRGAPPNERVVDFHSHTNASHDVEGTFMDGFDTEANLKWHRRAGFDAAFITDHNVVGRRSAAASRRRDGGIVPCPGIEVSAW
ncbi:MAG TPA: hypothetical protein VD930_00695, partial [Gemmatimonadales bacterium]|nr:hypothetical protein [Gemmatimonadales bacterium]